jgi:hypothetical protein
MRIHALACRQAFLPGGSRASDLSRIHALRPISTTLRKSVARLL